MKYRLKRLADQVVVITGASSGIGLATAREAALHGARLVLACRDKEQLDKLVEELRTAGGDAVAVQMDVGRREDHERLLQTAIDTYGQVDTWINNAGVSIFGRIEDVPLDDQRKLFDTNYWGVVYGSVIATAHLRRHGGALINVGSEVSDRAVPLQGAYSASKHAVKGFTDALRMELEAEGVPVSVTLVKPASIATRFTVNARNYMDVEPRLPPPVYAPEVAARAILYAAEHPRRDIYVGGAAKAIGQLGQRMPRLADKMTHWLIDHQRTTIPARARQDGLEAPGNGAEPVQPGRVLRHSAYTHMATRGRGPLLAAACAALLVGAAIGAAHSRRP
ncbi:MAG: SDR family oxidoreductase [Pigmentiphaga sp.]|uniref:SDR family oxidoreductase n=1 Tax=Pigmentiphaga sp. TaxID=1977564 RepID=UPI0029ABBC30|nr:SDR family oxidoreductase [Pigmentiphaga sp.]MDX3905002.1 SDR family oxidoreductase [Pigmentiphaga sp.]